MRMALKILRRLCTRDALGAVLGVVLAAAVCIGLGFWQWHRFEGKRENADVIETNYSAAPVGLDQVLPSPGTPLASSDRWKQVELTGKYCTQPDCLLWVRNRPLADSVGFWQLVPFTTDQGTLLVVRGWVDGAETSSTPASEPPVPEGRTTIVVRMRVVEPTLENRRNPPGQVQTVTPSAIAPELPDLGGSVYTGAFGELVSEDPSVSPMPHVLEEPDTSLGPHLSYAVQWWLFAAFFPIALVVRTRRQILDEESGDDESSGEGCGEDGARSGPAETTREAAPTAPRAASAELRRSRPRTQDEEEEDELLDHGRR